MRWFDMSFAPMKKVLRTICALVSLEASTAWFVDKTTTVDVFNLLTFVRDQ